MIRRTDLFSIVLLAQLTNPGGVLADRAAGERTAGNRAERLEWFRDAGFGLFIHWSLDSQLGSVISHSLVGASDEYTRRYVEELPKTFNPRKFHPHDWAVLARLAGARYVVFTAKHHSGFCMFRTATTQFGVMNTPYGRDITAQILTAFREQGMAAGLYFSPDDFYFLHTHGRKIARPPHLGVSPQEFKPLLEYDRSQLRELLSDYGKIDVMFIDGPAEGLREVCWEMQPDIVVTRGAIETPEQYIPGIPMDKPWEACLTMGTQWQYKPTNEDYKSGSELIRILIETRAKGGNLLLNVGPKPDGELPIEQEERLREIALFNFVNGEAIYGVRPWIVTNENTVWFTRKKGEDTVYAFVTDPWKWGEPKSIVLKSIQASPDTVVSVLGHSGEVLEYRPDVVPRAQWQQTEAGLRITAYKAQRLYNDRKWPNPTVLRITHVKPGMAVPEIETQGAEWMPQTRTAILRGTVKDLGKAASVQAGFQYRRQKSTTELYEKNEAWQDSGYLLRSSPGAYSVELTGLKSGQTYTIRAVVKHPLITIYGTEQRLAVPR